jgi:pyridoxamine 5'-phosphate oxidase
VSGLREEYGRGGLDLPDLAGDPIEMFQRWLGQAVESGVHEPNAMVLSTATPEGGPSSRMVLLKGVGPDGFVFYTNRASRKGAELAADPRCALLFPWHPLERQVRVEGAASVIPDDEVEAYFRSRPVASRAALAASYARVQERFGDDGPVPVPPEWGGYRVRPEVVEFWQGRPSRMHDRLVYRRGDDGWTTERLAP